MNNLILTLIFFAILALCYLIHNLTKVLKELSKSKEITINEPIKIIIHNEVKKHGFISNHDENNEISEIQPGKLGKTKKTYSLSS